MSTAKLLLAEKLISKEQYEQAYLDTMANGATVGFHLIKNNAISSEDLVSFQERKYEMERRNRSSLTAIPPHIVRKLSNYFVHKYRILPISSSIDSFTIGITEPTNNKAMDEVTNLCAMSVRPILVSENDMTWALQRYYSSQPAGARDTMPIATNDNENAWPPQGVGENRSETLSWGVSIEDALTKAVLISAKQTDRNLQSVPPKRVTITPSPIQTKLQPKPISMQLEDAISPAKEQDPVLPVPTPAPEPELEPKLELETELEPELELEPAPEQAPKEEILLQPEFAATIKEFYIEENEDDFSKESESAPLPRRSSANIPPPHTKPPTHGYSSNDSGTTNAGHYSLDSWVDTTVNAQPAPHDKTILRSYVPPPPSPSPSPSPSANRMSLFPPGMVRPRTEGELLHSIIHTPSRNEIISLALEYMLRFTGRALFFIVKKNEIRGFHVAGEYTNREAVRSFWIPFNLRSTLGQVAKSGLTYLGPIGHKPADDVFCAALGGRPSYALVVPIILQKRTIGILFADNVKTQEIAWPRLNRLTEAITQSLTQFILKEKKIQTVTPPQTPESL